MQKKYFVYISSTLDDVRAERGELIRTVTGLGSIPVTMDNFNISEDEDRRLIFKAIEECDYFLNLTAHKGGEMSGKSPKLELEYSHALKAGLPVFALIIGEKARWKASKKEKSESAAKALESFKKKLANHTHDTWINIKELKQKALELLSREMNLNPRRGWVPASDAVEPSVANELSRLIRENEIFRSQIRIEGKEIVKIVKEQARHTLKVLASNRISLAFYYIDGDNWENTRNFRYLRLFRLLAPEISKSMTAYEISHFLGNILNPDLSKTVRKEYPTPSNTVKKVLADFSLLKLIKCSGAGDAEAWEMTEFGKEVFAAYRLHQMNKPLKKIPAKKRKAESGA